MLMPGTTATYQRDRNPHRRLRHAAWKGDIALAKVMVTKGGSVEGRDGDKYTPLLIASRWDRLAFVKYLVEECHADLTVRNGEGDSAYNLAKLYGHDAVAEYLLSAGCSDEPNSLRIERKESADQWLAKVTSTPSAEEIAQMRSNVHTEYERLRAEAALAADPRKAAAVAETAAIKAATGLDGDEADAHRSSTGGVVGQLTFPVSQRFLRKAPRFCRLGVGSMGLAMFDGQLPVATWIYARIIGVETKKTKNGSELIIQLSPSGKKKKKVVFTTLAADEIRALVQEKIDELIGQNLRLSQESLAVVVEDGGDWLNIDGTKVPFELAGFGPRTASCTSPVSAVPFPIRLAPTASTVAGSVAVLECRSPVDAEWVQDLLVAQTQGAIAALLVNFAGVQLMAQAGDELAQVTIPVLVLPMAVGAQLVDDGAAACSYAVTETAGGATAEEGVPPESPQSPTAAAAGVDSVKTVWVGGIPESLLTFDMTASSDTGDEPIASLFKQFGAVVSLTTRQKPGINKSWAFVTFADSSSADLALSTPVAHGSVVLQVARADVAERLKSSSTGALARIWQAQQEKEEKWIRSLLEGLDTDTQYIAAKSEVAKVGPNHKAHTKSIAHVRSQFHICVLCCSITEHGPPH